MKRALAFVRARVPETIIVTVGIALRFSMLWTYDPRLGFDWREHLVYIEWFRSHWSSLPPLMLSRETYHPPLYYFIAGIFGRLRGGDVGTYALPPIVFSCLTLILLWVGLERHVRWSRVARIVALALAATISVAVHLSGMMYGEALNGLLALAALLLAAELLLRQGLVRRTGWLAVALGLVLGLQMLTKISALVTLAAIGATVGVDLALRREPLRDRLRRLTPWLLVLGVFFVVAGWYFARNHRLYGKTVLSGFDGVDGPPPARIEKTPYWDRRAPSFVYGWSTAVFVNPHYPSDVRPVPHFWPVLVASTFVDYYHYHFVSRFRDGKSLLAKEGLPRPASAPLAVVCMAGGALIAVSTAIAWLWALAVALARRDSARLVFLIAPALAVLGQLHFATRYPMDYQGPIKGTYVQFAAASLFALFGLAVDAMARRRLTRPIAVAQCAAVLAVAAYTFYARIVAL